MSIPGRILALLGAITSLTARQMASVLNLPLDRVATEVWKLKNAGHVLNAGRPSRCPQGPEHLNRLAYQLTPEGERHLARLRRHHQQRASLARSA